MGSVFDEKVRSPVNRVAARVIKEGVAFDTSSHMGPRDQLEPYPLRPVQDIEKSIRQIIGHRYGRITVLGLSCVEKRWAVKCNCGIYTLRTMRAILNPANCNDCCEQCYYVLGIRAKAQATKTKKTVWREDLPGQANPTDVRRHALYKTPEQQKRIAQAKRDQKLSQSVSTSGNRVIAAALVAAAGSSKEDSTKALRNLGASPEKREPVVWRRPKK